MADYLSLPLTTDNQKLTTNFYDYCGKRLECKYLECDRTIVKIYFWKNWASLNDFTRVDGATRSNYQSV